MITELVYLIFIAAGALAAGNAARQLMSATADKLALSGRAFLHRQKQIGQSPIAHSAHRGIEPMRRGGEAASEYS